mmetsp:Transcript_17497/g.32220  ORF Transcript_17497/g.32220 Transcript_17497/m.32220 type:complete len:88 (-) Transcript_17497:27-290(-)
MLWFLPEPKDSPLLPRVLFSGDNRTGKSACEHHWDPQPLSTFSTAKFSDRSDDEIKTLASFFKNELAATGTGEESEAEELPRSCSSR